LRSLGPAVPAELTETLDTESARLGRYVANLLDMARLEAGSIRLKTEPVDLVDAVAAATHDLRRALAGHRVEIDLPADLPLVLADPQLLHHCLINLIDNACRYSPAGSEIRVQGRREGESVDLSIIDEGPGLPIKGSDALKSFSSALGSDRKGGSGLGLAIVNGFAEAMGISVRIGEGGGKGAMLTLRFPAALVMKDLAREAMS
jgi:two-component system sensor histidine kinase KdpD